MEFDAKKFDAHVEKLRLTEYPSLQKTTYLDHAGTTLYARSLIDAFHHDLTSNLYGNPHSASPASHLSSQRIDDARLKVLEYFNANPEHFDVVFTANATASIKLVADCFRDQGFWYGYHRDSHSSIVGVREIASAGSRCFVSDEDIEHWINAGLIGSQNSDLRLFAYPAQSNMTGHRPSLSWASRIRNTCPNRETTPYILLDAASYLTSGRLDLHDAVAAPDFIALSFYKIFGFPDLGALIVRKTAFEVLTHRRYFGGGTVDQVTVIDRAFHAPKRSSIHDFLEDGTLPFHNIVTLKHAIAIEKRNFGSAANISKHTATLISHLYAFASSCRHASGALVMEVHKDNSSTFGDPTVQGPIMAFSIRRNDGTYVGKSHVERLAIECGFQLRSGGVCNPGGIATMLNLNHWELKRNFIEGVRCGDDVDVVGGKPTGIVRVSLGPMSIMSDVTRFMSFIATFFVDKAIPKSPPPTQKAQQSINGIIPLEGANRVVLEGVQHAAYEVWGGQWCVVASKSNEVVTRLPNLSVEINVESENLIISHIDSQDKLCVSLWSNPPERVESRQNNGRRLDLYEEASIAEWLTQHVGSECTLARYQHAHIRNTPDMTTCVVANCKSRCPDEEVLRKHYAIHAEKFLFQHPPNIHSPVSKSATWRKLFQIKSKTQSPPVPTPKPDRPKSAKIDQYPEISHSAVSKLTTINSIPSSETESLRQVKTYIIATPTTHTLNKKIISGFDVQSLSIVK